MDEVCLKSLDLVLSLWMIVVVIFLIPVNVFAEENDSKCELGTTFDEETNTCMSEADKEINSKCGAGTIYEGKTNSCVHVSNFHAEQNTLDLELSYDDSIGDKYTILLLEFINLETQEIQEYVDYSYELSLGKKTILASPLTHTSKGIVKIPVSFSEPGKYSLDVEVKGILFSHVPTEAFSRQILVDEKMVTESSKKNIGESLPNEEKPTYDENRRIKDAAYNKFKDEIPRLMQLTVPQSEEEVWEFVGEEKSKRFKETFAGIKDRGISFDSINGIQMSRLSEYEQAVVKDAFIQSTEYMKYKGAELLYKIDKLREEIKGDIQETSLPQSEKDSIISDFDFYANSKRTEAINVIGNEIMIMQSSLSIRESPQKIGSDINSYYNDIARGKIFSSDSITNHESGGGCLIATATYGTELAPQVQQLREIRDNSLLQTESGTSFMKSFNGFYYSFSPIIADWERENPVFKEAVKLALTPLISSLSILNHVDMDSESSVLGYEISLIFLNVGMYFVAPVLVVWMIRRDKKKMS